jgi:hypothetical protein
MAMIDVWDQTFLVKSHLSTLYVVLHVRKIATQANNWK